MRLTIKFYVLEISGFITKFTENTNQTEDLKAKEGIPLYFLGVT